MLFVIIIENGHFNQVFSNSGSQFFSLPQDFLGLLLSFCSFGLLWAISE
jgi:hypothetical protein